MPTRGDSGCRHSRHTLKTQLAPYRHLSLARRAELRASVGERAEATATAWARGGRARPGAGSEWGQGTGGAVHSHARRLHKCGRLTAPPAACEAAGRSQREA